MNVYLFNAFKKYTAKKVSRLNDKQLIDYLDALFNGITLEKDAVLCIPAEDGYFVLGHSDQERGCPLCGAGDTKLIDLKPKS